MIYRECLLQAMSPEGARLWKGHLLASFGMEAQIAGARRTHTPGNT